jgi:hypothetical protein
MAEMTLEMFPPAARVAVVRALAESLCASSQKEPCIEAMKLSEGANRRQQIQPGLRMRACMAMVDGERRCSS